MLDPGKIYNELQSELSELDKERLRRRHKVLPFQYLFWSIALGGGACILWILNFSRIETPAPWVIGYGCAVFVFLISYLILLHFHLEKFKQLFTQQIAPAIVSGLGESFRYTYNAGVPEREIRDSFLFAPFDRYHAQDLVTGTIGSLEIAFSELKLVKLNPNSKDNKTETVFTGFYFSMKLSVTFPTDIWLVYGHTGRKTLVLKDKPRIDLGIPVPDKYRIYADNEVIAKKILQPFILDRLKGINENLKKTGISKIPVGYHFSGNHLQMAISSQKKFMEPKLSKTINDESFIMEQTLLLNTFTELIDELALSK